MDSLWLEQCRAGDSTAIEKLVGTYQRDVYRLALSILDDLHDAEDATQEVFLAALRALDSFHGEASFKTWLFSITINVSRSRWRRRQSRARLQGLLQSLFHLRVPEVLPDEKAEKDESDAALWRAVRALDDKHRVPVVLRYYHDLPVADIAAMLKIPIGTVHSRLNHARERLRDLLKEEMK